MGTVNGHRRVEPPQLPQNGVPFSPPRPPVHVHFQETDPIPRTSSQILPGQSSVEDPQPIGGENRLNDPQSNQILSKGLSELQVQMAQLIGGMELLFEDYQQRTQDEPRSQSNVKERERTSDGPHLRATTPAASNTEPPCQNHFQTGVPQSNPSPMQRPFQIPNWFGPSAPDNFYMPPGWGMPYGFAPPYDPHVRPSQNHAEQSHHDSKFAPPYESNDIVSPGGSHTQGREPVGATHPYYHPYRYGYPAPHQSAYPYAQAMSYPDVFYAKRMSFMSGLGIGMLGTSISSLALLCFLI